MNELVNYSDSFLSVLPPIVAILLAIFTRKVILSLAVGILVGTLMLTDFHLGSSTHYIFDKTVSQFWDDGHLQYERMYLYLFLILLGMMTSLISFSGAATAFANWAKTKIRSKKEAQLSTIFLGITVFIDDYFNSLVVGSISRPITDRYYISRAKLAYLLDSTAAPVCVLAPISSWGAYIIALIGGVLLEHGIYQQSYLNVFLHMIPLNFYAIFALLFLFCVVWFGLDIGPMRRHEMNAKRGQLYDESKGHPPGMDSSLKEVQGGQITSLFIPILALAVVTFSTMLLTGYSRIQTLELGFSWTKLMELADVHVALLLGGLVGLLTSIGFSFLQGLTCRQIKRACIAGAQSMLPAIFILIVASIMAHVIGEMHTGLFMSHFALDYVPSFALPAGLFILASLAAFATGSSFATFAIMLPIAADMAMGSQQTMLLPMMAAVLAGAVCGDHCSPISDTTILSSTGASCHHMDHVMTQLPYALIVAFISIIGYLVLGLTGSSTLAFVACTVMMLAIVLGLKWQIQGSSFKQLKPL
tara:strand:- start:3133 stop:4722 length:1590 start_codon:yes stop_codon:yes gene_type:complete